MYGGPMLKNKGIYQIIVILLGLQFFTTSLTLAQSSNIIRGTVADAVSKEPLPYSNISIVNTGIGAAADRDGNFIIRNIPDGTYTVRISYIGYSTQEFDITITAGETVEHDFELNPASLETEVVTITAQAEGQFRAINEQLSAMSIKNVVSSDRIQELPDANAAESVSRLPGVSLIRTGGEGSQVVVRGLSPQYNRVTIDGVELPGNVSSTDPDNHRTQFAAGDQLSLAGDRATDLSMISSNMLGGIEVIKAITPDMDATVFGGVVNFTMRKAARTAYEVPRFEILTQGSHNNLKDSYNDYKAVASYEQRFWNGSTGVFMQGSAERKNLSAQEFGAHYHFDGRIFVTDEGDPDFRSMNLNDVLRDRERYNATFVIDHFHSTGSIGLMNFFSRSDTRTISRSESYHLLNNEMFYSATHADNIMDVYSNLLSIQQSLGRIDIDARFSHSYSTSHNPEDVRFNFWQNGAGFSGMQSALRYARPTVVANNVVRNPESAVFFEIANIDNKTEDRTFNNFVDLNTNVRLSDLITGDLKVGGAFQYRSRSYDYNQSSGSVFYDDGGEVAQAIIREFPEFGTSITFADLIDPDYSYGTFLNGDYTLGPPLDIDLMLRVIEVAKNNPARGGHSGYKPQILASTIYDYSGNEMRSAAYAMITLNIGQMFTVLPGVRFQNLSTTYSGIRGESISGQIIYTEAEETRSHGYLLPNLHFKFKPLRWFQFHFAYTNTLNYPDYNAIIPRFLIGTNFVLYNNYRLKPATSENFDAVLAFFSNEIGLFTIGGFKKQIKDLIFPTRTFRSEFSEFPELHERLQDRSLVYRFQTYINNPNVIDLWGIETEWQTNFWYLPGPLSGLVLNINYTHIFSEAKYPRTFVHSYLDTERWVQVIEYIDTLYATRLLNQPNDVINFAIGYDYKKFSARLSMLYKDNIFKNPDFWSQNRIHSAPYRRWDLMVRQTLPWYNIQVYFALNNITGEDDIDVNQKNGFPVWQQRYGMTADVGVRVRW
jgi:TonB-dependent receptor